MGKRDPDPCFKDFRGRRAFLDTLESFQELCSSLNIDPLQHDTVFERLKKGVTLQEVQPLWKCLEKRASHKEYSNEQGKRACTGKKVLIVGAGPCGLRMAIECALLGAKVVVIDMRSYISRNNVLHLWPFVIQDIKLLGGKVFNAKFCVGAIDHVSIKRLQVMLLKICLCLGVEVHTPAKFEQILEPDQQRGHGWRVRLDSDEHPAARFDYDFIVGANGKNNSLPDFSRKTMRGKLAIAITANFVNRQTTPDAKVTEIGGLSFIFDQEFFNGLKEATGADLENFIYYKDDTHYFVMTPKKACLLKKGVIKQDYTDAKKLLAKENIDHEKLKSFTQEVAMRATGGQLPTTEFERNHYETEDLAIFDFTAISMANHSCYVREQAGHVLMQCIVGDSLLEPFWPTGTGCARGFLGVFDTAWLLRSWCLKEMPDLHIIAERESIFRILSQTKPEASMKVINKYTINPSVRYGTKIKTKTLMRTNQVKHLYVRSSPDSAGIRSSVLSSGHQEKMAVPPADKKKDSVKLTSSFDVEKSSVRDDADMIEQPNAEVGGSKTRKRSRGGTLDTKALLRWFQDQLDAFEDLITLTDLHKSWQDGLAFCALVQTYRPNLLDVRDMDQTDGANNLQIAFVLIEQEFGVCPVLSVEDLIQSDSLNNLAMLSYLTQLRDALENERPPKMPKIQVSQASLRLQPAIIQEPMDDPFLDETPRESSLENIEEVSEEAMSPLSPHGMLLKVAHSTALQGLKKSVENAKAWMKDKTTDQKSQEEHRKAVLLSNRTVSFKAPKASRSGGSKLSRKRVMFKVPPPAVIKYRKSQVDIMSGESNIDDYMKRRGLLASGSYDNADTRLDNTPQEEDTSVFEGAPPSLPYQQSNVLSRVAKFEGFVQEKAAKIHKVPSLKKSQASSKAPTPLRSRPSLANCRGIASGRILQFHKDGGDNPVTPPSKAANKDQSKTPIRSKGGKQEARYWNEKHDPFIDGKEQPSNSKGPVKVPEVQLSTSEVCCICEKKLFVVERHTAHGQFFHKNCYRCKTCKTMLRLGNSVLRKQPDSKVEFYCYSHAYTSGAFDVNWEGKEAESSTEGTGSSQSGPSLELNLSEDYENVMGTETGDEMSSEDSSEDEDAPNELSHHYVNQTYKHTLRSQRSLRLLVADDIKHGLDEVDDEEEKLEVQGHSVEEQLRAGNREEVNEEVMEEWIDIIRKKKQLVEKESKLMLKKKLVELQDRHNRLQLQMTSLGLDAEEEVMNTAVAALETDTVELEDEMECLVVQMKSLTTYLDSETHA